VIKAYHRASSNDAYEAILKIGAILPAAWRIHSDQALYMCEGELEQIYGQKPEGREGLERLLKEQAEAISELQKREGVKPPKNPATMLFCADLIAGDFMNVFLSPGGFTNMTIARGWPLSGFSFDAEELIRRGAEYRPEDFGHSFGHSVRDALRSGDADEAYEIAKRKMEEQHRWALKGDEALDAIQVFDNPSHDPTTHKEYAWPSDAEVVWRGPLPLDLAVELWVSGKLVETRVA
jgi:hypothetical protein